MERRGASAACAGLAGDGATVAQAGDGTCLSGGQNTQLSAGAIDLGDLGEIVGGGLPVPPGLPTEQLDPILAPPQRRRRPGLRGPRRPRPVPGPRRRPEPVHRRSRHG